MAASSHVDSRPAHAGTASGVAPSLQDASARILEKIYPTKKPSRYTEYEKKYPPDKFGEEAGERARVWNVYRDRVKDIDEDMLEGWDETLNVLLLFAGLFSAACTAFLIEVYRMLQPDWQQVAALTTYALYANMTGSVVPASTTLAIPDPSQFIPSINVRCINGLWFTSLTLSLIASLLAILAKQWINEFKSRMRAPAASPRLWMLRHIAYKQGLEKWGFDGFIAILPIFLHVSLFLFLIGLCVLLQSLDNVVAWIVLAMAASVAGFYLAASIAPFWWGDCPTATPIMRYIFNTLVYAPWLAFSVLKFLHSVLAWAFYHVQRLVCWIVSVALLLSVWPLALMTAELPYFLFVKACRVVSSRPAHDHRWFELTDRLWAFATRPLRWLAKRLQPLPLPRWRDRKQVPVPAFDQSSLLVSHVPFREAAALSWMIRRLPLSEDISTALCAIGGISSQSHQEYFSIHKVSSPLDHADVAVVAKDLLVDSPDVTPAATLARLLHARLVVDPHNIHYRRQVGALLSVTWPSVGEPSDRALLFLTILQSEEKRYAMDSPATWRTTDLHGHRLRALVAISRAITTYRTPPEPLMAYHRLLVQEMAESDLIPPPDLITRLHFVHDEKFPRLTLSEDSLDFMLDLVTRPGTLKEIDVTEKWAGGVANILGHYVRRRLRMTETRRRRITALLSYHTDVRQLVASTSAPVFVAQCGLTCLIRSSKDESVWDCVRQLLNLAAIEPIITSPGGRSTVASKQQWNEQFGAFVFACSVQLLTLHRRTGLPLASDLFNTMLDPEDGANMLTCTPEWRHHIALHGKVVCPSWWEQVRTRLQHFAPAAWASGDRGDTAATFVAGIDKLEDCLDCACDDVHLSWSPSPVIPPGHAARNEEFHPVIHYEDSDAPPSAADVHMYTRANLAIDTSPAACETASMELQSQQSASSPLTRLARQVGFLLSDPLRDNPHRSSVVNTSPHKQSPISGTRQRWVGRIDERDDEKESDEHHSGPAYRNIPFEPNLRESGGWDAVSLEAGTAGRRVKAAACEPGGSSRVRSCNNSSS